MTGKKAKDVASLDVEANPSSRWWAVVGVILALTLATRFYNVDKPAWVCWDETHFGKMGR